MAASPIRLCSDLLDLSLLLLSPLLILDDVVEEVEVNLGASMSGLTAGFDVDVVFRGA